MGLFVVSAVFVLFTVQPNVGWRLILHLFFTVRPYVGHGRNPRFHGEYF